MQSRILTQSQTGTYLTYSEYIPLLENGDRLTATEFRRRYEAMPNVKAELIKGVVYMSSPVRVKKHGKPHLQMSGWLFNYQVATPIVEVCDNSTLQIDNAGEPQPDLSLWIAEEFGGNAFINDADYLEGAPELIVEISSSTVSFDLHDKKDTYEEIGVKEYIVWRVLDNEIDWFVLENGKYIALAPDESGILESPFFGGLRLNVPAMLEGDLVQVLQDLQVGINSEAHRKFVENIRKIK